MNEAPNMTGIHDSATCRCEMCVWADSVERREQVEALNVAA